jgi:DnaJ-class molecular chaperone
MKKIVFDDAEKLGDFIESQHSKDPPPRHNWQPVYFENPKGRVRVIELKTIKIVCPRCKGTGVHDRAGFSDGFTMSEMAEMGQEFADDYASGEFDDTCSDCNGLNVVDSIDYDSLANAVIEQMNRYHQSQSYLKSEY